MMMNEEIEYELDGIAYKAEYTVFDGTLVTYLPDGSSRTTELRGLKPELAALLHLKVYLEKVST